MEVIQETSWFIDDWKITFYKSDDDNTLSHIHIGDMNTDHQVVIEASKFDQFIHKYTTFRLLLG